MKISALSFLIPVIVITQIGNAQEATLPEIGTLTKVVIANDRWGLTVKSIENSGQVKSIADFFNENRNGWNEAFLGLTTGAPLEVQLYNGTNRCATYGIAEDGLVYNDLVKGSKRQRDKLISLIGDLPKALSQVVLPGISNITEVVVMTNLTKGITRQITNTETINRIVELANRNRTGWQTDWFGEPMPKVVLKLKNKDGFVVEFCAGQSFLVRGEDEEFLNFKLKDVKEQEVEELEKLASEP